VTKNGDVWILGKHRLRCGDSTKPEDMKKLMAGSSADMVITDPPYNVDYQNVTTDMKIMNDKMEDAKFRSFLLDSFKRMHENMSPGAPIYVFHADTEGFNFRAAFKEAAFKLSQNLVWVKSSLVPGYSDYQWRHEPILYGWKPGAPHSWYGDRTNTTVIEDVKNISPSSMKKAELVAYIKDLQERDYAGSSVIRADKPMSNVEHPTMKPVKLIGKLMGNSSDKGTLVLDPFGGSGSTLIAAEQMERTCYMMELDPKYCDVIIKRWENLSEQKAMKA
jgi:DNA modification methylase